MINYNVVETSERDWLTKKKRNSLVKFGVFISMLHSNNLQRVDNVNRAYVARLVHSFKSAVRYESPYLRCICWYESGDFQVNFFFPHYFHSESMLASVKVLFRCYFNHNVVVAIVIKQAFCIFSPFFNDVTRIIRNFYLHLNQLISFCRFFLVVRRFFFTPFITSVVVISIDVR